MIFERLWASRQHLFMISPLHMKAFESFNEKTTSEKIHGLCLNPTGLTANDVKICGLAVLLKRSTDERFSLFCFQSRCWRLKSRRSHAYAWYAFAKKMRLLFNYFCKLRGGHIQAKKRSLDFNTASPFRSSCIFVCVCLNSNSCFHPKNLRNDAKWVGSTTN